MCSLEAATDEPAPARLTVVSPTETPGMAPDLGIADTAAVAMRDVHRLADAVAARDTTVLLTGETGSGKGVLARRIHERSPRKHRTFVQLNCAGLQRTLTESELFGHERGAFTGATTRKLGLLEVATRGTVFLDEIAEMDLAVQAKLLTILEHNRFRRVGGTTEVEVDVRLIAATHRDLRVAVRNGTFREDLFYRLDVFNVRLPPLRERRDDIIPLAAHFLRTLAPGGEGPAGFSPAAREALMARGWPGNVRELRNAIERACILCPPGALIEPRHLPPTAEDPPAAVTTMRDAERLLVERTLRQHNFNIKASARALELSRGTLYRKIRKYSIALDRP